MKKLIVIPISLLLCAEAQGQGDIIFNDSDTTKVFISNGPMAGVVPPGAAGYRVDLFYQPNNGGAAPSQVPIFGGGLGNWLEFGTYPLMGPPGEYLIGRVILPGITGGANVWLEVVGFDNSATSLANALQVSTMIGITSVISLTTSDPAYPPTDQPTTLWSNPNFTALNLTPQIPEPCASALGGLGAATLLFLRPLKKPVDLFPH